MAPVVKAFSFLLGHRKDRIGRHVRAQIGVELSEMKARQINQIVFSLGSHRRSAHTSERECSDLSAAA
jgi:hypothetical protein